MSKNMPSPSALQPSSQILANSDVANLWLLPDGVTDLLSSEAQKQEMLRYQLTRTLVQHGYELICPPMIEYTESLLSNASEDLKRQTFKIIDQLTGRLMGVRADITPQILRIDAHLNRDNDSQHIARYCYAGHVIHTLPNGLFGSRTPLQLGAEVFGCDDIAADLELLDVLYKLLNNNDLVNSSKSQLHIDVGQVGVFKRLLELAALTSTQTEQLMLLYANKALPELKRMTEHLPMGADFYALAAAGHDIEALKQALSTNTLKDTQVAQAIEQVVTLKQYIEQSWHCQVSVDITELSGYHYHTGLVFNVYLGQDTQPIARGGRFEGMSSLTTTTHDEYATDGVRPATGFSLDLTRLQNHLEMPKERLAVVDYATYCQLDNAGRQQLDKAIVALHQQDESLRVIRPLTVDDGQDKMTHKLLLENGEWVLQAE